MTKECKQQFTLRITQANATQLVVILYEMTLQYLADAEQAAEDAQFLEAVRRTRGCINELLNSLHRDTVRRQSFPGCICIVSADWRCAKQKPTERRCRTSRKVIAPLCDAYRQIQDQNSSGPVMNNSQTVYAGLTYGRNQLTENMADQGTNRGMLV